MQLFSGKEYLAIDIANNWGLDKKDWDERLDWFAAHEHELETLVPAAKEPALFYAGIKAWREVQQGKPIGYPISLDATSSGLQFLAALTGDRSAAELCNVVDSGHRRNAYTQIYQVMLEQLGQSARISADDVKQAVMTALYGSKAVPKDVFGEGQQLHVFYQVLSTLAPGAWELNEAFLALWNPTALSHDWVLPDNFHVRTKVMNQLKETVQFLDQPFDVFTKVNAPVEGGRALGANVVHSLDGMVVREMQRRCNYNPDRIAAVRDALGAYGVQLDDEDGAMVKTLWEHYQRTGYLSARILDHLTMRNIGHVDQPTIEALLDSLPVKPFHLLANHDCFRCLPHYGNDIRRQYNLQLHLIAKSDLLTDLISQLVGVYTPIGKLDPTLADDILEANYALS